MHSEFTRVKNSFLVRHAWLWLIPLSVLIGLLLLEGVLRQFPSLLPIEAQQRLLFLNKTGGPKSIGDPYLGFTYPPFYKTEMKSRDFDFVIESDEHGFRNHSPWPDTAEVVIVGDSMAYGYGVAEEQAWPTLLDEALPTGRVITLGMPGAVPQQYTRYFERFGVALKPKVLIYTIFAGNDILEASVFDRWLAAGSPGNYDVWRFFQGDVPSRGRSLLNRSYLLQSMRGVKRRLRAGLSSTSAELADGGRLQLVPSQFAPSIKVNSVSDPGFDAIVRAALEARDRARVIDCKFIVLLVPVKERVYSRLLEQPFPGLTEPLRRTLEHVQGITVLDLTDRLTEAGSRGRTLYFEVDGHPNVLGNEVIADYVTQYLRAHAQALGLEDWNQRDVSPTGPGPGSRSTG